MRYLAAKLSVSALFGALYYVVFELSTWLHFFNDYAAGISLVYLPAGIKLVAALVSSFWGVFGTVVALAYVTPEFWPNQPFWFYVSYPALSGFSTLAVVALMKRVLGIDEDIRNLRFIHIPIIDLCATLVHGMLVNGFFALNQVQMDKDFLTRALAMSVGDFLGSLILLLSFAVLARLYDAYQPQSVIRP